MSKFLGFLLGVAVALAGPAVFGVLEAPGGIELNTKEMALAFGIGALIFWAVVSYFSGAGALGAFVAFGTLLYCWLWIPNRTTNFLNDVPGVTTGMIEGSKRYTLNGVVPILAVISLVYGIQLIVHSVQRRRRERVEADRLQREQEAVQAQQEADAASVYPVAGSTYPVAGQYADSYESRSRFDDLFDDEQEPVQPRNQADEQTAQYPVAGFEQSEQYPEDDAQGNDPDETVLVPTDRDETVHVPVTPPAEAEAEAEEEPTREAPRVAPQAEQTPPTDPGVTQAAPKAEAPAAKPEVKAAPAAEQQAPEAKAAAAAEPQASEAKAEPAAEQTVPEVKDEPAAEQQAPEVKAEAPAQQQTPEGKAEAPAEQQAPEVKDAPAAEQTVPAGKVEEPKAPEGKADQEQAPVPSSKEQVGSQYRERMEEDTGEFHFTAFEAPVVRPAGT